MTIGAAANLQRVLLRIQHSCYHVARTQNVRAPVINSEVTCSDEMFNEIQKALKFIELPHYYYLNKKHYK